MDSLEIILEIGKRALDKKKKEEYANLKNHWYIDYIEKMTPEEILPGSLEFIYELKKENIKIAIGSASRNTPLILNRVNLTEVFDAVADGNIVHKAKPDPAVFLTAAKMLKVKPGKCVVFEDAAAGVQAALKAGMMCVGIGNEEVLKRAHLVVKGLYEMSLEKLCVLEKQLGYE
jgi:beta-phosphoglucomutase